MVALSIESHESKSFWFCTTNATPLLSNRHPYCRSDAKFDLVSSEFPDRCSCWITSMNKKPSWPGQAQESCSVVEHAWKRESQKAKVPQVLGRRKVTGEEIFLRTRPALPGDLWGGLVLVLWQLGLCSKVSSWILIMFASPLSQETLISTSSLPCFLSHLWHSTTVPIEKSVM